MTETDTEPCRPAARHNRAHGAQVVSNRMQKSILVAVDKWKYIAKYKTRIKRTKKLMVPATCNAQVPLLKTKPLAPVALGMWCVFRPDSLADAGTRRDERVQHRRRRPR